MYGGRGCASSDFIVARDKEILKISRNSLDSQGSGTKRWLGQLSVIRGDYYLDFLSKSKCLHPPLESLFPTFWPILRSRPRKPLQPQRSHRYTCIPCRLGSGLPHHHPCTTSQVRSYNGKLPSNKRHKLLIQEHRWISKVQLSENKQNTKPYILDNSINIKF